MNKLEIPQNEKMAIMPINGTCFSCPIEQFLASFRLMSSTSLNFRGAIEGNDVEFESGVPYYPDLPEMELVLPFSSQIGRYSSISGTEPTGILFYKCNGQFELVTEYLCNKITGQIGDILPYLATKTVFLNGSNHIDTDDDNTSNFSLVSSFYYIKDLQSSVENLNSAVKYAQLKVRSIKSETIEAIIKYARTVPVPIDKPCIVYRDPNIRSLPVDISYVTKMNDTEDIGNLLIQCISIDMRTSYNKHGIGLYLPQMKMDEKTLPSFYAAMYGRSGFIPALLMAEIPENNFKYMFDFTEVLNG